MLRMMELATTGLVAEQRSLDVNANNMANLQSLGFKAGRADFRDLLYQTVNGAVVGNGVGMASTQISFAQGALQVTSVPTDLAIQGRGFFQVQLPNGSTGYTRAGHFLPDANGNLVNPRGYYLLGSAGKLTLPAGYTSVTVSAHGAITAKVNGQPQAVGQLSLADFVNPQGLQDAGGGIFLATANSGTPQTGTPGQGELGVVRQRALEQSNVSMTQAMYRLITEERAYQMDGMAVQVSGKVYTLANQVGS